MGGAVQDLTGRRFGALVAVREVGREQGVAVWLCRCDCGQTAAVRASALRRGRASCGCARGRGRADLTGRRYGRWLVLGPADGDGNRRTAWRCRCACGTERVVPHERLQHRRTHSCGCRRRGRPRSEDPVRIRRDGAITAARRRGESLQAIATRHGLSVERVRQILYAAGVPRPGDRRRPVACAAGGATSSVGGSGSSSPLVLTGALP